MKKKRYYINGVFLILMCMLTAFVACSSKKKIELASIGDEKIWLNEFEEQFLRTINNLDSAKNTTLEQKEEFLDLFIKFRLKVKDARERGLLESEDIQKDLNEYKKNFLSTYLIDKEIILPNIQDIYEKRKNEVRASHILINLTQEPTLEDSIAAYEKVEIVLKRLKDGEEFSVVAAEMSDDPTAAQNGGDLYYFTGGMTVPEFEDEVFSMKVGDVSKKPIRTQFGLHVVKLTDKQQRRESVTASHILIQDERDSLGNILDSTSSFNKATEILARIKNGEDFAALATEFSMDPGSAQRGGDLGSFERRRMVAEFDSAVFVMEVGDVSDIIRTQFGWHIIKLNGVKEVAPFETDKDRLKSDFRRSPQFRNAYNEYMETVQKKFDFEIVQAGMDFMIGKIDSNQTVAANNFNQIFTGPDLEIIVAQFKDGEIKVSDVITYLETNREYANTTPNRETMGKIISGSAELNLLDKMATRENIEKDKEYQELLREYENGLLAFKVDQEELWSKIQVTDDDINSYYESNKEKYSFMEGDETKFREISDVRSEISNTLQQEKFKQLETEYIDRLKQKYPVIVKTEVLEQAFTEMN